MSILGPHGFSTEGNQVLKFNVLQLCGMLAVLYCSAGAMCIPKLWEPTLPTHPVVFHEQPDLDQLLDHLRRNSESVQRLSATGVQLRVEGAPVGLRSSIEYERPHRFKLTGEFMATSELDVGSNEQFLWIWGRHAPGALMYVRHDQYDQTIAHELMPVPPAWLVEALGVVSIDPLGQYSGPFPRPDGNVEIRSQWLARRGEPLTRILIVKPQYGWVVEQQIRDGQGRLLASSTATRFQHYPEFGVSLPNDVRVRINVPGQPQPFEMSLDIGGYTINGYGPPDPQFWSIPDPGKLPALDLADPRVQEQLRAMLAPPAAPRVPVAERQRDYRYEYRGYSRDGMRR